MTIEKLEEKIRTNLKEQAEVFLMDDSEITLPMMIEGRRHKVKLKLHNLKFEGNNVSVDYDITNLNEIMTNLNE